MKKIICTSFILLSCLLITNAQELGIRFGNGSVSHVAVDGIFSTGKFSRIHADLSFNSGVGVDILWDFLYRPLGNEAFNWYLGAGPYTYIGENFELGIISEIGLEYHFKGVPIAIGADWRPVFRLIDNTDIYWEGYGINVRYVF